MLDMGFAEDIAAIVQRCPPTSKRQTLLFSATYPDDVAALAARYLREPQEVKLTERHAASQIRQRFYEVTESERLHAVGLLLNHFRPESTLAFCNTKQQCRDLVAMLQAQGIVALELHGDLEQRERDQVLVQFANRSCSVLVATDVAARGLDITQARGGDQRRHHARRGGAHPPRRPHRPRRRVGPGASTSPAWTRWAASAASTRCRAARAPGIRWPN